MSGMQEILAITASILNIASMTAYFRQLRRSESIPNPATWLIWLGFTSLNFLTYFATTHNNVWISLLSLVNTTGTLLLFSYSLARGKFAKIGKTEITSLTLAIIIGVYWKLSGNSAISNVALQVVLAISYYPTYVGLLRRTLKEKWVSWSFSTLGYAVLTLAVLLDLDALGYAVLAFPVTNMILNFAVTWIAFRQKKLPVRF